MFVQRNGPTNTDAELGFQPPQHNAVRISAPDSEGRQAVTEYVLRSPFSLEKLRH